MRRAVAYDEGNAGIWRITCATCPLIVHAEAMGLPSPDCLSGIATNMQGPMVMKKCEHTTADSVKNEEGNTLSIDCGFQP